MVNDYLACVASVSVRFRSKERGTRVKDRAKNGVSKRAGRGYFHFLALVSFLARPKPRIPFLGLSLLRNQTETLATQADDYLVETKLSTSRRAHSAEAPLCRPHARKLHVVQ